jgi:preprotein translocase subunit SecE
MIAKIRTFGQEVVREMQKVSWPTREQLRESTVVVVVTCLLVAAFTWLVDTAITAVLRFIF